MNFGNFQFPTLTVSNYFRSTDYTPKWLLQIRSTYYAKKNLQRTMRNRNLQVATGESLTSSYIFSANRSRIPRYVQCNTLSFLATLGERLNGTLHEMLYLFKRRSIIIHVQRFNSVFIDESFVSADEEADF